MDLKDYYKDRELKFNSEKSDWQKRADICVQETIDLVTNQMKHKIEEQIKKGTHETILGVKIKIEYRTSCNYSTELPRFSGYISGWTNDYDVFYEWNGIRVNNEDEAVYCLEKTIKDLEASGLKTSIKKIGGGLFASLKKEKGYFISYNFNR